jgi:hypothetical protein
MVFGGCNMDNSGDRRFFIWNAFRKIHVFGYILFFYFSSATVQSFSSDGNNSNFSKLCYWLRSNF